MSRAKQPRPWPPSQECRNPDCEWYGKEQHGDYETVYFDVLCEHCGRPTTLYRSSGDWVATKREGRVGY